MPTPRISRTAVLLGLPLLAALAYLVLTPFMAEGSPPRSTPSATPAAALSAAPPPAPAPEASSTTPTPGVVDTAVVVDPSSVAPPGFPAEDRFDSISEACVQLTKELVPTKYRRAVYDYCEHRSYHSSRYNVIKSKVDQTQVHDRDRPFAWRFYNRGLINGTLDPDACVHHQIDRSIRHPKSGRKLARDWPFGRPRMSDQLRGQWMDHPHDMERFGTRGGHDNHLSTAVRWVPGCYPPEALDRNDVNASVTILRAVAICEDYGCRTKHDIRKRWRNGPKRKRKKDEEAAL